jgi:lipopolysaccharide export system protein LptC
VKTLVKDIWERLLLYLPVAFMALLALGTYWLVRSTPDVGASQPPRPVSHDPDYFMEGFSMRTFDASGRIRTEVTGDKARHYPDTLWLEIDEIRIRSFDERGRLTTATAKRGLTNEDSSEAQLIGNAVVVREADAGKRADASPRTEYRGEFLHAFIKAEKVKSHKPVELIRGNDRFTADSLDFDNVDQVLQLHGRVKGVLMPGKP